MRRRALGLSANSLSLSVSPSFACARSSAISRSYRQSAEQSVYIVRRTHRGDHSFSGRLCFFSRKEREKSDEKGEKTKDKKKHKSRFGGGRGICRLSNY